MTALLDPNGRTELSAVHPVAARTATGTGSAVDVRAQTGIGTVILDAAAGTGTAPTLALRLQDSPDGSTGWADIPGAAFAQVGVSASVQRVAFNVGGCRGFVRAAWTIGGTTPSFTFSATLLARLT